MDLVKQQDLEKLYENDQVCESLSIVRFHYLPLTVKLANGCWPFFPLLF